MANLSGIRLRPLDEGESVEIPSTKTTIGRGSFLQVSDKRVSRNHATLEISDAGKLVIVPIHTNPCFFKMHGNGQQIILPKDKPKVLEHGDVLSLLPDKFFFQVVYRNEDGLDDNKKDTIKIDGDLDDSCEEKSITVTGAGCDGKEMALPLGSKRALPTWMKGAAKRVGLSQTEPKSSEPGSKTESNYTPASKMPSRPKTQQPISKTRTPRKSKKSDSEELDLDEEEEERPAARKDSRQRKIANRRGRRRGDDYEDDEEEEEKVLPIRRPRAASLKKPKYTDDDFVISDEELDLENMLSESERDGGSRKGKDEDSDFVLDEEDSGSDWESHSRKTKAKHGKLGRSSSGKGRGSQRSKRRRVHNSDSFSDEDSDGYVPRLSKRRAAAAATTRMKASKFSDDDYSENSDAETRKPKRKKAKGPSSNPRKRRPKRRVSDDEEDDDADKLGSSDEEMDVDDERTGKKEGQDGKACYGKKQKHFEDISHPQNDSGKGDDSESDERKGTGNVRQKRAAAVRQQEKLAALHNESEEEDDEDGDDFQEGEDDNMKKTSVVDEDSLNDNGNCSRGSDSDFDPEDEESADRSGKVKHLMPNKLKQKAAV